MYDSVIIGSGPAGLTAAIYLSRAGLKNIIINGMEPGGQLTTTTEVENFPGFPQGISGPQLIEDIKAQSKNFGTEFLQAVVKDIEDIENNGKKTFKLHLDNGNIIEAKTIILSTGASAKYLGIENEKENIGRGVSACATCDGFFYRGKDVVVIGGGDTAMEEAIFLTKFVIDKGKVNIDFKFIMDMLGSINYIALIISIIIVYVITFISTLFAKKSIRSQDIVEVIRRDNI